MRQFEQRVEYILAPTLRNISLLDAVKNVGLVDIESRADKEHPLPPTDFYRLAKDELLISGISADRTFDMEVQTLRDTLAMGKRLRVLILRPDCDIVRYLEKREVKPIHTDIEGVIQIVLDEGFITNPNFAMHLTDKLPTFTAVMIDGDVEKPANDKVSSPDVQVRIQPTTIYHSQHDGLVIQLKKSPEIPFPLVDFVAGELREQWAHAIDLRNFLKQTTST